jgi:thiol-disulfide isomerase/thioredoxin
MDRLKKAKGSLMRLLSRRSTRWVLAGGLVLAVTGWLASRTLISASEDKPAATSESGEAKQEPPLKTADIKPDMYVIPANAEAHQLLKKIHEIAALRPQFESEDDAEKFLTVSRGAILKAADQLLKGKHTEEQEVETLKSKLQAYQVLLVVGVKDAFPKALKFAEQLKEDKRPVLAELGQQAWIDFKMSTVPTSDAKERSALVDIIAKQLAQKPRDYYEFATNLGQMLEIVGDGETAAKAYAAFGDILSKNLDENLRANGEKMRTGAVQRARLLTGDPVKVSGKTLDGQPFDISQYKGKVVVVDFWATWCGPCRAELSNIKAVYEKYHNKGLEVVGVSLDEDKDALIKFLAENHLPWKILVSTDPHHAGFENPIADRYGISGIPTVFLMNRDGKVISLAARGEQLATLVGGLINGQLTAPPR